MATIRLDTSDSVTDTKIPKLTNISTYYDWRNSIQASLEERNLWQVTYRVSYLPALRVQLDGEEDSVYQTAVEKYYADNSDKLKEDERAKGHIKKTLGSLIHDNVSCDATAYTLFKSLVDKFETKTSDLQKHYLISDLYRTNYKDGDDLPEFLATTNAVIGRLASFQHKITAFEQANIILTAFRSTSYEQIVATLINTEQFDPEKIQASLETEWTQRQHDAGSMNAGTSRNSTALYGQSSRGFKKSNNRHDKKNQHSNSKSSKPSKGKDRSGPPPGPCFICGVMHWVRDCPQKHQSASVALSGECLLIATNNAEIAETPPSWILDSGATSHFAQRRSDFHSYFKFSCAETLTLGNGTKTQIVGKGAVHFSLPGNSTTSKIILSNVLHVPSIIANLLSLPTLFAKGIRISSSGKHIFLSNDTQTLFTATLQGNLFHITPGPLAPAQQALHATQSLPANLWHHRLGHASMESIYKLQRDNLVRGIIVNRQPSGICEPCAIAKTHRLAFLSHPASLSSMKPLDTIVADACGPFQVQSLGGHLYFVTFIDVATRKIFIRFIRKKSQIFEEFKAFLTEEERQTGRKLKIFRSDNGGEFTSNEFNKFLSDHGIKHQLTVPYTPQQNGIAERTNRTIVEMVRAMLNHSGLTGSYWAEAAQYAVLIRNHLPSASLDKIVPEEAYSGNKPTIEHFRVFGCLAYSYVPDVNRQKLDAQALKCIHLGYWENSKAYRLQEIGKKIVIRSRNVRFDETKFLHTDNPYVRLVSYEAPLNTPFEPPTDLNTKIAPATPETPKKPKKTKPVDSPEKKKRIRTKKGIQTDGTNTNIDPDGTHTNNQQNKEADIEGQLFNGYDDGEGGDGGDGFDPQPQDFDAPLPFEYEQPPSPTNPTHTLGQSRLERELRADNVYAMGPKHPLYNIHHPDGTLPSKRGSRSQTIANQAALMTITPEPLSDRQARSGDNAKRWEPPMHDELRALVSNRTWQIQQLPQNRRSIPCRWVYKNKLDGEGNLVRRKARLVAKGFTQRLGIDFEETFAPVAKMTSARTLIALATVRNWELDCVDVDNAYLNGDLKEEIYMEVPPGYDLIDPKPVPPGYALRLLKSLYGLKQAGRSWNEKIHESLVNLGFKECPSDPCIYARKTNGAFIGIVLYVDDLLLASNSRKELDAFKLDLSKLFKLKDLGPAKHILGIRIMRNRQLRTTKLDQEAYIKSIVKKFNLATASTTATPLPTGQQLSDSDSPSSNTEIAEMSKVPYLQALGSVMYAMIATRPDIAHSVGVLSRFSANPGRPHWEALKHLIRYLKGTSSLALTYSSKTSTPILSGYSDADFAADTDTRRSTSGYVFCINNTAISWASKKQPTPAASTAEAEYIALATGASELLWLEFILNHLDAPQRRPLTLHADNQAAISIAKNPTHHSRAKHIDVKYHFVRHRVVNGHINVVYIPTQSMLADIFTKTLPRDRHQALTRQLGLIGNTSN